MVLKSKLISDWNEICNRYLEAFIEKHEFEVYEPIGSLWVNNNVGEICEICDMFINMSDIRYDIDNNIAESKFEEWYWKNLEFSELGLRTINYENFCKGCPLPYTEEDICKIKEARQRVAEAKKEFEELIESYGGDKKNALIF